MEPLTEPEVRALRDQVYGEPSTDKNWDFCREHWMRPDSIEWLLEQIDKMSFAA